MLSTPSHSPKINFTPGRSKLPRCVNLITSEVLMRNMEKAAAIEDYEMAIIFRNELLKRGKLQALVPLASNSF